MDKAFIRQHFPTPEQYRAEVEQYLRTRQMDEAMRVYVAELER